MELSPPKIIITPLRRVSLPNGDVLRGIHVLEEGYAGFGEAYFSYIHFGEIKGWKLHQKYTANFLVPFGKVQLSVCKNSSSKDDFRIEQYVLANDYDEYCRITVPPGYWYCFHGLKEPTSLIFSFLNGKHDPEEQVSKDFHQYPCPWEEMG